MQEWMNWHKNKDKSEDKVIVYAALPGYPGYVSWRNATSVNWLIDYDCEVC